MSDSAWWRCGWQQQWKAESESHCSTKEGEAKWKLTDEWQGGTWKIDLNTEDATESTEVSGSSQWIDRRKWRQQSSWDSTDPTEEGQEKWSATDEWQAQNWNTNETSVDATESAGAGSSNPKAAKVEWQPYYKHPARHWAHIFLFKRHVSFDLVPMLIGRFGNNLGDIWRQTGAKLRVRGRGSGHLEVGGTHEAPVPLMLAVTSNKLSNEDFRIANERALRVLEAVSQQYRCFCDSMSIPFEPVFAYGEVAHCSKELLDDLLQRYPHPEGPKPTKRVTPGGIEVQSRANIYATQAGQSSGMPKVTPERKTPRQVPPPECDHQLQDFGFWQVVYNDPVLALMTGVSTPASFGYGYTWAPHVLQQPWHVPQQPVHLTQEYWPVQMPMQSDTLTHQHSDAVMRAAINAAWGEKTLDQDRTDIWGPISHPARTNTTSTQAAQDDSANDFDGVMQAAVADYLGGSDDQDEYYEGHHYYSI